MECPFCGQQAGSEDRFCGKCGGELLDRRVMDHRHETIPVMSVAEVHRRLGLVYYRQGNRRGALESWARSLKLEPGHGETRELLAQVRSELEGE